MATMDSTPLDFTTVTETLRTQITREAAAMMYGRYRWARDYAARRRVLEVACGSGQGLGLLAEVAQSVVAGDCTAALVEQAQLKFGDRATVMQLDAHELPLPDGSCDVVLLFEAIYYLADPGRFLHECRRVLSADGVVLICSANPERPDFNPSPFSQRYFSACELAQLLSQHGFSPRVWGAFPVATRTLRDVVLLGLRKLAVKLHLMPKKMGGKALLKRLFYGSLVEVDEVREGMAPREPFVELSPTDACHNFKVIYAAGARDATVPPH